MSLRKHFQTCLDLPGVTGAFCLRDDGALIESFMPSPYTNELFDELGPRIISMIGAVDMSYAQSNEFLLRFEANMLYLKKSDGCIIGIFTTTNLILAGLRVSTNLLLKQSQQAILSAPLRELASPPQVSPPAEQLQTRDDEVIAEDDDVVVSPRRAVREEPPEEKKTGFFGSRKKKKKSSTGSDIWG